MTVSNIVRCLDVHNFLCNIPYLVHNAHAISILKECSVCARYETFLFVSLILFISLKTEFDTMPHGDFSDIAALTLIAAGVQQIFKPTFNDDIGPIKANFDGEITASMINMIKLCGGFCLVIGCMLFTVRWNTLNGKLSGIALIGCAANIGMTVFHEFDGGVFVPRLYYVYSAVLALAGLHLMFNANPLIKAAADTNKSK